MLFGRSWILMSPLISYSHVNPGWQRRNHYWDARDAGLVVVYLPGSVVTDIFSIVRRQADIATAFAAIDHVLGAFGLLAIDAPLLQQARALPGNDFEDNVQIACALNAQLDVIITRNLGDFQLSPVPAIEPSQIT